MGCRSAALLLRDGLELCDGLHADRGGKPAMPVETVSAVYECPSCGERLTERRCPDCNMFCRRLGAGGGCPACGEVVLVAELESDL